MTAVEEIEQAILKARQLAIELADELIGWTGGHEPEPPVEEAQP